MLPVWCALVFFFFLSFHCGCLFICFVFLSSPIRKSWRPNTAFSSPAIICLGSGDTRQEYKHCVVNFSSWEYWSVQFRVTNARCIIPHKACLYKTKIDIFAFPVEPAGPTDLKLMFFCLFVFTDSICHSCTSLPHYISLSHAKVINNSLILKTIFINSFLFHSFILLTRASLQKKGFWCYCIAQQFYMIQSLWSIK